MITSSTEGDFQPKTEGNPGDHKINKASSSSSTPWSLTLKNPRIVRVSRALGGKDRHSKVCTVRGLRDRRVRLSVPTAIQLYDLQHRLGLNQPSKVVDWLLNEAKDEIDELPPLPTLPSNFGLNHPEGIGPSSFIQSNAQLEFDNNTSNLEGSSGLTRSNFFNSDVLWRTKSKEVSEKENWAERRITETKQHDDHGEKLISPNNFSFKGMMNNTNPIPYIGFQQMEPANFQTQSEHLHNSFNIMSLPSSFSLPTGSAQIFICPTGTQSYLPPQVAAASFEIDPQQVNHVQTSRSSSSQNLLPYSPTSFNFSMAPKFFPSNPDNNGDGHHPPNKNRPEFPFKMI